MSLRFDREGWSLFRITACQRISETPSTWITTVRSMCVHCVLCAHGWKVTKYICSGTVNISTTVFSVKPFCTFSSLYSRYCAYDTFLAAISTNYFTDWDLIVYFNHQFIAYDAFFWIQQVYKSVADDSTWLIWNIKILLRCYSVINNDPVNLIIWYICT